MNPYGMNSPYSNSPAYTSPVVTPPVSANGSYNPYSVYPPNPAGSAGSLSATNSPYPASYPAGTNAYAAPYVASGSFNNPAALMRTAPVDKLAKKSECSVIIRDLSFFCNENHLKEIISCYGPCVKVHLCRSEESNHRSLLHAFVEMENDESIVTLIEELNGVLFMGRQMKIQRCHENPEMKEMVNHKAEKVGIQVYVRFESMEDRGHGLVNEERLREVFSDCGDIEDAIIQRHSQNLWRQKGYGFLYFLTYEGAEYAIKAKNGIMYDNVYYQCEYTHKAKERITSMNTTPEEYQFYNVGARNPSAFPGGAGAGGIPFDQAPGSVAARGYSAHVSPANSIEYPGHYPPAGGSGYPPSAPGAVPVAENPRGGSLSIGSTLHMSRSTGALNQTRSESMGYSGGSTFDEHSKGFLSSHRSFSVNSAVSPHLSGQDYGRMNGTVDQFDTTSSFTQHSSSSYGANPTAPVPSSASVSTVQLPYNSTERFAPPAADSRSTLSSEYSLSLSLNK